MANWTPGPRAAERLRAMLTVGPFVQGGPSEVLVSDRGTGLLGIRAATARARPENPIGLHEAGPISGVIDGRLRFDTQLRSILGLASNATDAETVVAGFERFGVDLFGRLRGDFAIVLWDVVSKTLVAARDSFGIRSLCFAVAAGGVAVASDPEQIIAAGLVSRALDEDMVLDYLLWDARSPDRTFFREIKAIPGGHVLVAGPQAHRVFRYDVPNFARVRLSSREEYWGEYRERFSKAVEWSIASNSPVVAELSGGLDSSSIVGMADRLLTEKPTLCPAVVAASGLYPGLTCDEEPFIRAVAARVLVPVKSWNATATVENELDSFSVALPGGRFATFAGTEGQVDIMRELGAQVLISGMGGDQIGTSSGVIRDAVTERRWGDAARMVRDWPRADATMRLRVGWALARSFSPPVVRKAKAFLASKGARPFWLSEWAKHRRRRRDESAWPPEFESEVQRRNWRSLTSGGHALATTYLNHHSIRSGIEVRFPFLDLDLVSIALSIPARLRPPPWPFERLHRDILRNLLPREVFQRRSKADFLPALAHRVRRHLPQIRDLLATHEWASERFVDRGGARRLLHSFETTQMPDQRTTYNLWAIATVEAWMRGVFKYDAAFGR